MTTPTIKNHFENHIFMAKKHVIDPSDIEDFEGKTIIASESGVDILTKRLYIHSKLVEGMIDSSFVVTQNDVVKYRGQHMAKAIEEYNKL